MTSIDQKFKGKSQAAHSVEIETGSWIAPLLMLAAGAIGSAVGLIIDGVLGTNTVTGAILQAIGGQAALLHQDKLDRAKRCQQSQHLPSPQSLR